MTAEFINLQLTARAQPNSMYESLKGEGEEFWAAAVEKVKSSLKVTVKAKPSIKRQQEMEEQEAERLKEQKVRGKYDFVYLITSFFSSLYHVVM